MTRPSFVDFSTETCIDVFSNRSNKMPHGFTTKITQHDNLLRLNANVIHIICVINYQSNLYYLHTRYGTSLCVNSICDVYGVLRAWSTLYPLLSPRCANAFDKIMVRLTCHEPSYRRINAQEVPISIGNSIAVTILHWFPLSCCETISFNYRFYNI